MSAPRNFQHDKTAAALEWPLLLDRLAQRTRSKVGAAYVRSLEPEPSLELSELRAARTREALALFDHGAALPIRDFPDLGDLFERLSVGSVASSLELIALANVLGLARELRNFARVHRETHVNVAEALTSDPALDKLYARLSEALEPDGTVSDRASPALKEARRRAREVRDDLKRRLAQLIGRYADVLSGQYYTEREGRYVIPVRSDAHLPVEGIVLGSSASGSTLFVEPREVTELGNKLRIREAEVEREEARVLIELSALAATDANLAEVAYDACVEADLLSAAVQWAADTSSHVLSFADEPLLELHSARHPLLLLSGIEVIPNDIRLRAGEALVISGPNAGGKTVALKTLGLVVCMARAGLPVPVGADSRIGWFDQVLTDIGDEQSIVRSLSTFSAHVESLRDILQASRRHTLVLLDEVAAGTDPEEGAALAASVLEGLTERDAAVAVTTHYERLKEIASRNAAFVNASVGFDFARMAPTFQLTIGVPGASSALAVASRHGMPESVLARAKELLPEHSVLREEAVHKLQLERQTLEALRTEAETEARRQSELREQLEAEQAEERERTRTELDREVRELRAHVRQARTELQTIRSRLKESELSSKDVREAERALSRIAAQVALGGRLSIETAAPQSQAASKPISPAALQVGALVRLKTLGAIAEVLELGERGQLRLRVGALKLTANLSDVEAAPPNAKTEVQKQRPPKPRTSSLPKTLAVAVRTRDNTLDLRGVRVEEGLEQVDAFMDRLVSRGESLGFVLHGHGTGAMKAAVREHLALSSYVENARPAESDEGGDAFTVFWLRA